MSSGKSSVLKLAFIGMSGIGKSFWSARLQAEAGFSRVGCDDEIQKILAGLYPGSGVEKIDGVATWMKNPWESGHKESEREYLALEERVTTEAISALQESAHPFVIDTTGSVIYLQPETLARLSSSCTTVLFEHSSEQAELLYRTFLEHPKPLIWGSSYTQRGGETHESAMARSFRELLSYREAQYRKLAQIVIPIEKHKNEALSVEGLLSMIRNG